MEFADPWTYQRTTGVAPAMPNKGHKGPTRITSVSSEKVVLFSGADEDVAVLNTGAEGWTWDHADPQGQPEAHGVMARQAMMERWWSLVALRSQRRQCNDLSIFTVRVPRDLGEHQGSSHTEPCARAIRSER